MSPSETPISRSKIRMLWLLRMTGGRLASPKSPHRPNVERVHEMCFLSLEYARALFPGDRAGPVHGYRGDFDASRGRPDAAGSPAGPPEGVRGRRRRGPRARLLRERGGVSS